MGQFSAQTARSAERLSACLVSQLTSQALFFPHFLSGEAVKGPDKPFKTSFATTIFTMCFFYSLSERLVGQTNNEFSIVVVRRLSHRTDIVQSPTGLKIPPWPLNLFKESV